MASIICKSILAKSKLPKVDYGCNIYVGCTHGCKYCYASFMRRFTNHANDEWGSFVDYKENAVTILKEEIKKKKGKHSVLLGSVTDCYQPLEKELRLTRECLEIFSEYEIEVSILTKSVLVLRDIDILKRIKNCEVGFSCGIGVDKMRCILEPGTASLDKRIAALKALHSQGIRTYAFIGPIIPGITDLSYIFSLIYRNVDYVMGEYINLRGCNKSIFKKALEKCVGNERANMILKNCCNTDLIEEVNLEYETLCNKYKIENRGFFKH